MDKAAATSPAAAAPAATTPAAAAPAAASPEASSASPAAPAAAGTEEEEELPRLLAADTAAVAAMDAAISTHGLDSVPALAACVAALDAWIPLYKLQPMDELLQRIWALCRARYQPAPDHVKRLLQVVRDAKEAGLTVVPGPGPEDTAEKDDAAAEANDEPTADKKAGDNNNKPSGGPDDTTTTATTAATKTTADADADNSSFPAADSDGHELTAPAPSPAVRARLAAAARTAASLLSGVELTDSAAIDAAVARADLLDATEAVARRNAGGDLLPRAMQLKAFLRYKQHRFRDSLALFAAFKALVGPSAELLENMGHAHNTVGEHERAVACFTEALGVVRLKAQLTPGYSAEDHSGGLLLGLGVSLKRTGRLREALETMQQARDVFIARHRGKDHSLVGKALSAMAETHALLGEPKQALAAHLETVRIFRATCGVCPLTANALAALGLSLLSLGLVAAALEALDEALAQHCGFDTLDLPEMIRITDEMVRVRGALVGQPFPKRDSPVLTLGRAFGPSVAPLRRGVAAMEGQGRGGSDDAAVFYKSAGEVLLLAGEKAEAKVWLGKSLALLRKVTAVDCTGLMETLTTLIAFCDK